MTVETVRLGDVAEFINGSAFGPTDWTNEGRKIIRIQNLTTPDKPYNRTSKSVDEKYHVQPGELLVSWSASLGVYEWSGPDIGLVNQHIFRVVPDASKVDRDYLRHALSRALSAMERYVHGSTMRHVNRKEFLSTKIPLPPLPEQRRIAAILDKADAVRHKRQQTLDLADQFLRSAFLDMFGDPVTNPKGWGSREVRTLCQVVRGSSPRPKGDPRYFDGPVPRLMVADITRDGWLVTPRIDSLTEAGARLSRPVPKGTVVMVVSGNVGVVAKLQSDACIHDGFVGFVELDQTVVEADYFLLALHFLKATHEQRKAGAIWQNLTTHDIKRISLATPPLPMQIRVHEILLKYGRLRTKAETTYKTGGHLFDSLVQSAFRGELVVSSRRQP